jgi:membrane-bound lytic murein transglycosylase D
MTFRRFCKPFISCFFLLLIFTSCTTSRNQYFGASFLPRPPKVQPVSAPTISAPPAPDNYRSIAAVTSLPVSTPALQAPPKPSQLELRLKRAQERFEAGKRLYEQGDLDAARTEFDRALDILLNAPEDLPGRERLEARIEQLAAEIYRFDVNGLGAGDLAQLPAYDKAPLDDILEMTFPVDPSLKPKVAEQVKNTSSGLPLQVTDAVLSYINYFSSEKGRRTLIAGLRRAGRYKNMISRILEEERVPQELIYLAQAESGFLPRARSHKAAVGMWQFVQWRGREYGLLQSRYSDDRMDPEKSTRSAARHLRDLYEKFGDWYLAIAAYNCGPGCIEKGVERTGYADFWELRNRGAVPKETTNYVPIILAMTIMAKNPKAYGLEGIDVDQPLEYETITLTAPTHLALVADAAERPVSEIRELNPALLTNVAPAGYELKVPKGSREQVLARLERVPESRRASWRIHRVAPGETLSEISSRYKVTAGAIQAANSQEDILQQSFLLIPTRAEAQASPAKLAVHRAKSALRGAKKASGHRLRAAASVVPHRVVKRRTTQSAARMRSKPIVQNSARSGLHQRASLR